MQGMKQWQETRTVFLELDQILDQGHSACLALLHSIKGSSFRRPGAKLLIRGDGSFVGNISGGCLEEDLRERAARCLANHQTEPVHYDTSDDENNAWGLGLGCGGEVDITLYPITPALSNWVKTVLDRISQEQTFSLGWNPTPASDETPAVLDPNPDGHFSLTEVITPPPRLILCGAGIDTEPLVAMGEACGFRVTVIDHRKTYLDACRAGHKLARRPKEGLGDIDIDATTSVVVKMHALNMDREWATYFSTTHAGYVGLLGPGHRRDTIMQAIPASAQSRFHGPAGLDIGGEGAEQMAVSILAEILSYLNQRDAQALRKKTGPIHGKT
ncbi:MAG: XdhC family protein [Kiritimatiellae bacterium]|nr:XdhC family protein [Kiritimatiellia bacterium]